MPRALRFWVDFDEEVYSDESNDVVHVHFEDFCPVCGAVHSGTTIYWAISDCIEAENGVFCCESCNSRFKIVSYDYAEEPADALIEVLEWNNKR